MRRAAVVAWLGAEAVVQAATATRAAASVSADRGAAHAPSVHDPPPAVRRLIARVVRAVSDRVLGDGTGADAVAGVWAARNLAGGRLVRERMCRRVGRVVPVVVGSAARPSLSSGAAARMRSVAAVQVVRGAHCGRERDGVRFGRTRREMRKPVCPLRDETSTAGKPALVHGTRRSWQLRVTGRIANELRLARGAGRVVRSDALRQSGPLHHVSTFVIHRAMASHQRATHAWPPRRRKPERLTRPRIRAD
jgi:hypothetical protein